jgi:hypothetical protein
LWRKAATKAIVSHAPSGTVPITRSPLGARPLTRAKFVLTAVSSINTNRVESSMPCSRIQRRRARPTSARCRSAACRLFLTMIPWRSRKRQSELRLVRIRRLRSSATVSTEVRSGCWAIRSSICSANSPAEKRLLHAASARRSCFRASAAATLPPPFSRLAPRRTAFNSFDYAFPQITRIGLRHRPPPQRRINARRFAHP